MIAFTEKQRKVFYDVLGIVNSDCATIKPKGMFAKFRPEEAWLTELLSYACYLAKADGKVSEDEQKALTDMLGDAGSRINKTRMKLLAFSTTQEDINNMPYALPEIIARDNQRLAAGLKTIPTCLWLVALYVWISTRISMADNIKGRKEEELSEFVVFKSLDMICDRLNLPEATIKDLSSRAIDAINH